VCEQLAQLASSAPTQSQTCNLGVTSSARYRYTTKLHPNSVKENMDENRHGMKLPVNYPQSANISDGHQTVKVMGH